MRLPRFLIVGFVLACVSIGLAAAAQNPTPLSVKAMRHHGDGIDRVFEFDIANALDAEITAHGRLVVINVYGAGLPETLLIDRVTIPADGVSTFGVRWPNAPLIGPVRALLVLTDDTHPALVESFTLWLVPLVPAIIFIGIALVLALLTLVVMRAPHYFKTRVPSTMIVHVIETDDTIMTLASRFDVTWQDLVRANRLKPPYALIPGRRLFIPKHGLKRPEAPPSV